MVDKKELKDERHLRNIIAKCMRKEIDELQNTKPCCDFIYKVLNDAYASGIRYDINDMKHDIRAFCAKSTNNAKYCLELFDKMKFSSEDRIESTDEFDEEGKIIFYDIEVFPNLFLVNWKVQGSNRVHRMINPTAAQIEEFLFGKDGNHKIKLVGFNNRRYDNHLMYARMMGFDNEQMYRQSQRIIHGAANAFFGEAYNLSYADVYDFSSKKQSLKKWEIELGIHHQELNLPWDQPVPEDMWDEVAEYCDNDVIATEKVFEARIQDFVARQILADISGLTVNDTTRLHTTKIIFGDEKKPELVYTDLSEMFPGYEFENGKGSSYMGEDPGEGGYVYAEPGIYYNVALLDIASMHPSSIINLNLFGKYTPRFKDILDARLYIKHHDFEKAKKLLNGALEPYLKDEDQADALAGALKIVINSVYGYTTATFDNPFRDPRNVDNIVAKRGALFMINLKHEVQKRGYTVAHIKTDSIKIPEADEDIIKFVMEYGKQYGYNFEHEATYDRMCLVNDAVYVCKYKGGKHDGEWDATGTQFQVPYVFKSLFTKEPIKFEDMCETKQVSTALYLDLNEDMPEGEHNYRFIGRVGQFCPILPGHGGGELMRENEGKYSYATGCKGWRWLESEFVRRFKKEDDIDIAYYAVLVDKALATIEQFGDYNDFLLGDSHEVQEQIPFDGSHVVKAIKNHNHA